MKITVDIEKSLIDEAKKEIYHYYYEAMDKARTEAEKDIDRIASKIILKVKYALKALNEKK